MIYKSAERIESFQLDFVQGDKTRSVFYIRKRLGNDAHNANQTTLWKYVRILSHKATTQFALIGIFSKRSYVRGLITQLTVQMELLLRVSHARYGHNRGSLPKILDSKGLSTFKDY